MRRYLIGGLLLAALCYGGMLYVERRAAASDAARDAQFKAAIGAIQSKREAEDRAGAADRRERDALRAEIAANRRALAALEARSGAAAASTARDVVAADTLVAHPSCEALTEAARRLRLASFRCQ